MLAGKRDPELLDRVAWKVSPEQVTFKERPEGMKGGSLLDRGTSTVSRGHSGPKPSEGISTGCLRIKKASMGELPD